jgi:ATP-binding cassette subfamily B (MDR/TAP) protein 1
MFLILLGLVSAVTCGAIVPVITKRFGRIFQVFVDQAVCKQYNMTMRITLKGIEDEDDDDDYLEDIQTEAPDPMPFPPALNPDSCVSIGFMDEVTVFSKKVATMAVVLWGGSYLFVACLNYAAERQVFRIRLEFLKSILRQDLTWYDTRTTSDFATRLTEDLNKLQEGIGEKIGMLCYLLSTFVLSLLLAFQHSWQLTLLLLSMIPMMGVCTGFLSRVQASYAKDESVMYAKAGAFAEEVLANIKTVVAYGGETKESEGYKDLLKPAKRSGIMRNALTGASGGLTFAIMYSVYGLAFWYGLKLIFDDRQNLATEQCQLPDSKCEKMFTAETLVIVFFSLLMGGFQIGLTAPFVEAVVTARGAAASIFTVIGRRPPIDSASERGMRPVSVDDNITVRNLSFSYPSRRGILVLADLNFEVRKGQTVALVGSSGSIPISMVTNPRDSLSASWHKNRSILQNCRERLKWRLA